MMTSTDMQFNDCDKQMAVQLSQRTKLTGLELDKRPSIPGRDKRLFLQMPLSEYSNTHRPEDGGSKYL